MSMATAYRMKKKIAKDGGPAIKGHGKLGVEFDPEAAPREGYPKSAAEQNERLDAEHARVSEMQRRKPNLMAQGGEIDEMGEYDPMEHPMPEENESANMEDADMIARIMHKRKMYSKGGQVSNDVGVAEADKLPAEYDDLVLRDDDMEDADYTGANSGDEKGNEAMDERDGDLISKIMRSRKKKDRMPRPA